MEHKFLMHLYESFSKLVEKYGFIKSTELNEEGVYSIEYRSYFFVIKLEKYRRGFYVALYKTEYPESGVDLFNLLDYLNRPSLEVPKYKFFIEEEDLEKCYKNQFQYIADIIDDNFTIINDFFKDGNIESEMTKIANYMINKYPNLFKRLDK